MATSYYNVKAKLKWAKVYEPDEYAGAERWMVNVYPVDGKEWEKIQKSGLQSQPKEDEDGKYIVLRRPTKKLIGENLVIFCPPEITGAFEVTYVDKEGNKVRSYNKGEKTVERKGNTEIIGNGSTAIVNFCVYDTRQGKGGRLESIKILDLVGVEERVKEEDLPVEEEEEKGDGIPW